MGYKHPNGSNDYRLATSVGNSARLDMFMGLWVKELKSMMPPMKTPAHDFIHMQTAFAKLGRQQGWFRNRDLYSVDSINRAKAAIKAFRADNTQE